MELNHAFDVPVPADHAWVVLTDVERIAPCMPGATLESVDGDEFSGRVKVKVGPIQLTYTGTARFATKDAESRTATIEAKGRDKRGGGTADATITATLTEKDAETTAVTVHTDLAVTGKPAQFGRSVLSDVGHKLLGHFAECLAEELAESDEEHAAAAQLAAAAGAGGEPAVSEGVEVPHRPREATRRTPESIDLIGVAGAPVARRLAPVLAVVVAVVLWLWWRRRP